jgi:integrase
MACVIQGKTLRTSASVLEPPRSSPTGGSTSFSRCRQSLDRAVSKEWLADNPARKIDLLREDKPEIDPFSLDEVKRFIIGAASRSRPTGYRPLDVANLRERVWRSALGRAKRRARTLYQTRHTFATLRLELGEFPGWVARQLGHGSVEIVTQYDEGVTGPPVTP